MNVEPLFSILKKIVAEFKTSRHLQVERRETHYHVKYHWWPEEDLPGAFAYLVLMGIFPGIPLFYADEMLFNMVRSASDFTERIMALFLFLLVFGMIFYGGYKFVVWMVFGATELNLYEDHLEIHWWHRTGIKRIDFTTIAKEDIHGLKEVSYWPTQLRLEHRNGSENLMDSRSADDRAFLKKILETYLANKNLGALDQFLASEEALKFRSRQCVRRNWLAASTANNRKAG